MKNANEAATVQRAKRHASLQSIVVSMLLGASVLAASPAQAITNCRATTTCDSAYTQCVSHRNVNNRSRAELPCENSLAACHKTKIWRGKYMRGTPEVNECKIIAR